jgi:hypothetical protein
MQDSNRKEDGSSHQEAPHCVCKAGKDMREPSDETRQANK